MLAVMLYLTALGIGFLLGNVQSSALDPATWSLGFDQTAWIALSCTVGVFFIIILIPLAWVVDTKVETKGRIVVSAR
jgi:hypothetical protein